MSKAKFPSEARHLVKKYIADAGPTLRSNTNEFVSTLERFSEKYKYVDKEIGWAVFLYSAISFLYFLKILGIRLDLVIFNQRVLEIPYGLFVYAVVALLLFMFACVRSIDSVFYGSYVKEMCKKKWGRGGDLMYHSYVGERSWMWSFFYFDNKGYAKTPVLKALSTFYIFSIGLLIQLPIAVSPLIVAICFLQFWEVQAVGDYKDVQWWIILALLIASLLMVVMLMALSETSDPAYEDDLGVTDTGAGDKAA